MFLNNLFHFTSVGPLLVGLAQKNRHQYLKPVSMVIYRIYRQLSFEPLFDALKKLYNFEPYIRFTGLV